MPKMYTAKQVIKEVKKGIKAGKSTGDSLKAFGLTRGQWSGMTFRLANKSLTNNATYSKGGKAKKKKPAKKKASKASRKKVAREMVSAKFGTSPKKKLKRAEMFRSLMESARIQAEQCEAEAKTLEDMIKKTESLLNE